MKVIFLDRDGVINEFPGNGKYVTKIKEFHFIPGSIEAIKKLTDQDYKIFIIFNYCLTKLNQTLTSFEKFILK